MDSLGGVGRELTTDEKIAALQKEVQAQVSSKQEEERMDGWMDGWRICTVGFHQ